MFRHSFLTVVMTAALIMFTAVPYSGGARPRDNQPDEPSPTTIAGPEVFDASLAGFHFGMTKAEVETFVRARVEKYYADQMARTRDVRKSDDLLRERNARLATVATDWISFDGSQTGWSVSIIRFEFKNGFGEEALHVQDGHEHFYYFFTGGVLYKLVRTWEADRFAPVKDSLKQLYGPASFRAGPDDGDRRFLSAMRWHGNNVTVDVEDWTEQFNSYTVRWADAVADAAVVKGWGDQDSGLPRLNPLIDAAKEENTQRTTDPVDQMLGR